MLDVIEALTVPQRTVSVRVELQDGRSISGVMYVPAEGPDHGPSRLIDRLETSGEFLALTDADGTHLVRLAAILAVHVNDEAEERAIRKSERRGPGRCLLVRAHLSSGAEAIGHVSYVQPPSQDRLQDFLNTRRRFLALEVEGRHVYVNRRQVVSVFELGEEPLTADQTAAAAPAEPPSPAPQPPPAPPAAAERPKAPVRPASPDRLEFER